MTHIIPFPGTAERKKLHGCKSEVNQFGRVTSWTGTKEKLVKAGICNPRMFPPKRHWAWAQDRSWAMGKQDDGTWRVIFFEYKREEHHD